MVLGNKLQLTSQVELNRAEERLSKQKAKQLFESGDINNAEVGTFAGLAYISTERKRPAIHAGWRWRRSRRTTSI